MLLVFIYPLYAYNQYRNCRKHKLSSLDQNVKILAVSFVPIHLKLTDCWLIHLQARHVVRVG